MLMCLDVGNSQIHGGIFQGKELMYQFRKNTSSGLSSDELGIFLRSVLRENKTEPRLIRAVSICSVVPHMDYSLKSAIKRYFTDNLLFVQPGVKSGLRIKYGNPNEVGADRIVTGLAAQTFYTGRDLLVVDFGTATTVDAISKKGDYLGGAILGGAKLMVSALESKTAKLPSVEILKPEHACGTSTVGSIQSGIYWSTVGGVKELTRKISDEVYDGKRPTIIGTGGVGKVFLDAEIFDHYLPDLVLQGLRVVHEKNQ